MAQSTTGQHPAALTLGVLVWCGVLAGVMYGVGFFTFDFAGCGERRYAHAREEMLRKCEALPRGECEGLKTSMALLAGDKQGTTAAAFWARCCTDRAPSCSEALRV